MTRFATVSTASIPKSIQHDQTAMGTPRLSGGKASAMMAGETTPVTP